MASSSASTSKPSESKTKVTEQPQKEESHPHLGVLEEDDEFDEFTVAGVCSYLLSATESRRIDPPPDWNDSQTDLAHLGGVAPGAAKSGGDKLWEDNWDDDDIEDEFSVQLRYDNREECLVSALLTGRSSRNELAKTGKGTGQAMEH
jgi:26 proteasome complex subunit DSS1